MTARPRRCSNGTRDLMGSPPIHKPYMPPTRMAPRLAPIPRVYDPKPDVAKVKKIVKKPAKKRRGH